MLCKRIITVLTLNNGALYRTKVFHPDYVYTTNFLDFGLVDEMVILDITRDASDVSREAFRDKLNEIARQCFVPIAAGGRLRKLDDVDSLFELGIDKIVLNSGAFENPKLIGQVAKKYGSQAVVVAIDALGKDGEYEVMIYNGSVETQKSPQEWAKIAEMEGAGEIMITSIQKDGSLSGYDLELSRSVVQSVQIPVLVSGGAGNWKHFEDGFVNIGAEGVCTTNIYHFTEASMTNAKMFLSNKGIPVRM